MSPTTIRNAVPSASALTLASYASFIPIGIATVLLGPMLPALSERWSLNYAQAGALFTAQYIAATCAVAVSGVLVSSRGYLFAIKTGLLVIALALALLLHGGAIVGVICIAAYGAGLGIAVPAGNLLVAHVNPDHRSASLNTLNFLWSAGAVACPFLVSVAARTHHLGLFLLLVAVFSAFIALGIAFVPNRMEEPVADSGEPSTAGVLIGTRLLPFLGIAGIFLLYAGTENAFGGWIASYARSLGGSTAATSLMTPSFFYAALMIGRLFAPFVLRTIDDVRLAQVGLFLGCAGTAGLIFSQGLTGVLVSASATGLGLSSVYPIAISLLAREFGPSSPLGSVMFVLSNIGGGLLPWVVGVFATRSGTLKAGLFVPLAGCILMLTLLLRRWSPQVVRPAV